MSLVTDSAPREMYEKESIQRFLEGLKLSSSCAKELHAIQPKRGWNAVHTTLENLFLMGSKLSKAKALTRQDLLQRTDRIAASMGTDQQQFG